MGAGIEGCAGQGLELEGGVLLYLDLGSMDDPGQDSLLSVSTTGGRVTTHTNYTDNIVRLGLNYRLN